jgi:hypothetical protein
MNNWDDRNENQVFDPHSVNAMFATLLERMNQSEKDRTTFRLEIKSELGAIKEQVLKTNGRVTRLEEFKQSVTVRVATITAVVGGIGGIISWSVSLGLHRLFIP